VAAPELWLNNLSLQPFGLTLVAHKFFSNYAQGRFEILCLSGSYLVAETGGSRNRTGGVNVSLSSSDGHVIGGAVGGRLIASRPVQVLVTDYYKLQFLATFLVFTHNSRILS